MLARIVSGVSILGVLAVFGCQQQTQDAWQRPAQQDTRQVLGDADERQRYVAQARRQIEGVYNAARELEQVAARFQVADQFAPYRRQIIEHLQTSQDRVSLVEQIDEARLDAAIGYLAEAIDGLFDAYNEAAVFVQRYLDAE